MEKIEYRFTGDDPAFQRLAIDVLARCFEVWAERKIQYNNRFPFREYSFIAIAGNNEVVGHLGIIPFDVCGVAGKSIRMAGVASVAVAPEWRKRGIAAGLCHAAVSWAKENGFDALPLYTSLMPVYEKCGWKTFPAAMKALCRPATQPLDPYIWKSGELLHDEEKTSVINLYETKSPFPGRVVRVHDDYAANSWARLFSKPNHLWHITDGGYILSVDGVIAEIGGVVDMVPPGIDNAFLSVDDPAYSELLAENWQISAADSAVPRCWDGEVVMMNILHPENIPAELSFPLAHKF